MLRFPLRRYFLSALFLFLWATSVPAQESQLIAPPLPSFFPEAPPDPDTLPPPPALEWEALPPAAEEGSTPAPRPVLSVPAPEPETELPSPPVPATALAVGAPGADALEKGTSEVEVWREESEYPQMRSRSGTRFEKAFIAGNEPVLVRLQFDPLAAGKAVIVRPGPGVAVEPPETEFEVGPAGECVISVRLTGNYPQSRVDVYCDGIRTALPLARATLAVVQADEMATGGGE